MSHRKAEIILFSMVALFGFIIQAGDAKSKNAPIGKTAVKAKKAKEIKSTQFEYPPFTCPGLREKGYFSHFDESEPKQNWQKFPRKGMGDHTDLAQFLNGSSDSYNGFDAL